MSITRKSYKNLNDDNISDDNISDDNISDDNISDDNIIDAPSNSEGVQALSIPAMDNSFAALSFGALPTGTINKDILIYPGYTGSTIGAASQLDFKLKSSSVNPSDTTEVKASLFTWGEHVNAYDTPIVALGGTWNSTLYAPQDSTGKYNGVSSTAPLILFHPATGAIDCTTVNTTGGSGTVNGLTLTSAADGFSIAGGAISRTATITTTDFTVNATTASSAAGNKLTLTVPGAAGAGVAYTLNISSSGTLALGGNSLSITGSYGITLAGAVNSVSLTSNSNTFTASNPSTNIATLAFAGSNFTFVGTGSQISSSSDGFSIASGAISRTTTITTTDFTVNATTASSTGGNRLTLTVPGAAGAGVAYTLNISSSGTLALGGNVLSVTGGNVTLTSGNTAPNVTIPNLVTSTALVTQATGTQYGVAYNSTAVNGQVAWTTAGTAGYPLVSQNSSAPIFAQIALSGGTSGITGTLGVTNGGTGTNAISSGQVLVGSASNVYTAVTPSGTNHISVSTSGGTFVVTSDGTNINTVGTLVARDASGNFFANAITANSISLTTGSISATPAGSTDIVNKQYVDGVAGGFEFKQSSRVATITALAANYSQTQAAGSITALGATITATSVGAIVIDGVALLSTTNSGLGDRVLVAGGISGTFTANAVTVTPGASAANGIYNVTQTGSVSLPYILTRATDCNDQAHIRAGIYTFTEEGTAYADNGFSMITFTDVTPITFAGGANTQMIWSTTTGSGSYTAGQGLFKTGSQFNASIALTNATNSFLLAGGGGINATTGNNLTVQFSAPSSTATTLQANVTATGVQFVGGTASSTLNINGGTTTLKTVSVDGSTSSSSGVTFTAGNATTTYVLGNTSNLSLTSGTNSVTVTGGGNVTAIYAAVGGSISTVNGSFVWKSGINTLDGTTNSSDGYTLSAGSTTSRSLVITGGNSTLKAVSVDGTTATSTGVTLTAGNNTTTYALGTSSNISLTGTGGSFTSAGALTFAATASLGGSGSGDGFTLTGGATTPRSLAVYGGNFTVNGSGNNIAITGGGNTFTISGNLTFSGAFATTFTLTGTTSVTLPVSGTLITTTPAATQLVSGGTTGIVPLAIQGSTFVSNYDVVQFYSNGTTPSNATYTLQKGGTSGVNYQGYFYGNGSLLTGVTSTGVSGQTQYAVVLGGASGTFAYASPTATAYALVSNGVSANPSFQALSLTAAVSGILPIANGGTNNGSLSVAAGTVLYGNGTQVTSLAAATGGILYSSASAPVWLTTATTGQLLLGTSAGVPTFSSITSILTAGVGISGLGAGVTATIAVNQATNFAWTGNSTFSGTSGFTGNVTVSGGAIALVQATNIIALGVQDSSDSNNYRYRVDLTTGQQALVLGSSSTTSPRSVPLAMTAIVAGASVAASTLVKFSLTGATAESVTPVTISDVNEQVVGIAMQAGAVGASIYVARDGKAQVTADTTAVAVGDYLGVSATTAGYVVSLGQTKSSNGYIGRAMTSKVGGSAGLVTIFIDIHQATTTGSVTGSGTQYYHTMWGNVGGTTLTNSNISQNATGAQVTIGAASAQVLIGSNAAFTGALNLPSTTAPTGGIYFGTDTFLYRSGVNALTISGGTTITTGGLTVTAGGLTVSANGAAITGNSVVTGTFTVSGANLTSLGGGLTVTGAAQINNTLTVAATYLTTLTGGAAIGGLSIASSGAMTFAPASVGLAALIATNNVSDDATSNIKLQVKASNGTSSVFSVDASGTLRATAKSFDIPHPTKAGKRLVYGVLEGPEHGVYHRGFVEGKGKLRIELPEYWSKLAGEDYSINLTDHNGHGIKIVDKDAAGFSIIRKGLFGRWLKLKVEYYVVGGRLDVKLITEEDEK